MMLNTKTQPSIRKMSHVLGAIQQTARLRILLAIGEGEACVCHLEALLGYRQAYISQHLMALRKARLLDTHREGRYIFYRLQDRRLLELIQMAGRVAGVSPTELAALTATNPLPLCCCPNCISLISTQVTLEEEISA
jgi:ArsR family transcriptional regulator